MVSRQLSGEWEKFFLYHRSDKHQAASFQVLSPSPVAWFPADVCQCVALQSLAALREDRHHCSVHRLHRECV